MPICYKQDLLAVAVPREEAGLNISTVALRVIGGKNNWATLFLWDISAGTWPSRLGEARIKDSKICDESWEHGPENDCAGEHQQQF
jgi:hypothetical protein